MVSINVTIPPAQYEEMKRLLNPQQLRQAMFQTVSRTTTAVAKDIQRIVVQKTFIQPKYVSRVIKAAPPTGEQLKGVVTVSHEKIPAIAFPFKANKAGGVVVRIGAGKTIILKHAFVARVGSGGHRGIFYRAPYQGKEPPWSKRRLTPGGFAGHLPILQAYGPPVSVLVSIPDVLKQLTTDTDKILTKNLKSQLDRFLK